MSTRHRDRVRQPEGRDNEIWLDAERRLISAGCAPLEAEAISPSSTRKHIPARPPIAPAAVRTLP